VFELHAHSSDRSLDSGVRAVSIVEQAVWRGLDGVCLTEHNGIWSADDARILSERFEINVFPGMELGTDSGHVLVYGLEKYHPELLILERLHAIVQSEGAAMVMAHPMRPFHGSRPGWDEIPEWFHGIEAINGDHSDSEHGYLIREASDRSVAAIGGSDVHSKDAVGRCATVFRSSPRDVHELAALIRAREVAAVDFRPQPDHLRGPFDETRID